MTTAKSSDAPILKYDMDKPEYGLISPVALEELAKIYTMGKQKYGKDNWSIHHDKFSKMRIFNACMRHLMAWLMGETRDPESGLHHLAHASWNCFTLIHFDIQKMGIEDRPEIKTTIPDHKSAFMDKCRKVKDFLKSLRDELLL